MITRIALSLVGSLILLGATYMARRNTIEDNKVWLRYEALPLFLALFFGLNVVLHLIDGAANSRAE